MKKLSRLLSIALLAPCLTLSVPAQTAEPSPAKQILVPKLSVDVLSDTGGANPNTYMRSTLASLKKQWLALAVRATDHPLGQQQETLITITIAPDGHLSAMHLDDPVRDAALDKAAWTATKETSFMPPPPGMRDPNLKLRIHFLVE